MFNKPLIDDDLLRAATARKTRDGVPLLETRKDAPPVTAEFVNRLREELPNE